jgi:hypothetical protein
VPGACRPRLLVPAGRWPGRARVRSGAHGEAGTVHRAPRGMAVRWRGDLTRGPPSLFLPRSLLVDLPWQDPPPGTRVCPAAPGHSGQQALDLAEAAAGHREGLAAVFAASAWAGGDGLRRRRTFDSTFLPVAGGHGWRVSPPRPVRPQAGRDRGDRRSDEGPRVRSAARGRRRDVGGPPRVELGPQGVGRTRAPNHGDVAVRAMHPRAWIPGPRAGAGRPGRGDRRALMDARRSCGGN